MKIEEKTLLNKVSAFSIITFLRILNLFLYLVIYLFILLKFNCEFNVWNINKKWYCKKDCKKDCKDK